MTAPGLEGLHHQGPRLSPTLAQMQQDHRCAELTVLYSRHTQSQARQLWLGVVELLPPGIEALPEWPSPTEAATWRDRKQKLEFNLRRVQLPVADAVAWYEGLRTNSKVLLPPTSQERQEGAEARHLQAGPFLEEPPWPGLVLNHTGTLLRPSTPFWGQRPGQSRHHMLLKQEALVLPGASHDAWGRWVESLLHFPFQDQPMLWGSAHLVLPNPVFRACSVRLNRAKGDLRVTLKPYPHQNLSSLSLQVTEHRPEGLAAATLIAPVAQHNAIAWPHEPFQISLAIHCRHRGLLFQEGPFSFLRSTTIQGHIKQGTREVVVPAHQGRPEERYIIHERVALEATTVGSPGGDSATARLLKAQSAEDHARRLKAWESLWFMGQEDAATTVLRKIVAQAHHRVLIVDPYFSHVDFRRYCLANPNAKLLVQILTSAQHLKKDQEGELFWTDLQGIQNQMPGLKVEVRVMPGKRSPIHDRFLVVDQSVWKMGASFNAFGSAGTLLERHPDPNMLAILEGHWQLNTNRPLQDWVLRRKTDPSSAKLSTEPLPPTQPQGP